MRDEGDGAGRRGGVDSSAVEMRVSSLTIDPHSSMPIMILKDLQGRSAVPIWIGMVEASAIATELEEVDVSRPMTHDLIVSMLGALDVRVARVEITDLRDNTFYAAIGLVQGSDAGRTCVVAARPSDAIAVALRTGAPILVARHVVERSQAVDLRTLDRSDPHCPVDEETYRRFLENLSDDAFGRWKM